MTRTAPLCSTCQQRVSARGKQGLTCGSCNRSDHFDCLKITEESANAIISGDASYLCRSCKNKQRLSLSFVAVTTPAPTDKKIKKKTGTIPKKQASASSGQAKSKSTEPTASQSENPLGDTEVASLIAVIQNLQETIKSLESKLSLAFEKIEELQRQRPAKARAQQGVDKAKTKDFIISGVPKSLYKDPRSVAEKVLKTHDENIEVSESTLVKSLKPKDEKGTPVLLLTVLTDSAEHTALKKLRRRKLSGKDVSLDECGDIFVNESLPSRVYQLFRKARKLKENGVQDNRILARKLEGSPIHQIRKSTDIQQLIDDNVIDK